MHAKESDVFDLFSEIYTSAAQEEMSLQQYLLACREDRSMYATAPSAWWMRSASPRLSIPARTSGSAAFSPTEPSRSIRPSPISTAWRTRSSGSSAISAMPPRGWRSASRSSICSGPVGGGKSSLAERLKKLMEKRPIYTLKVGSQISPVFEVAARPVPSRAHGRSAGGQIRNRPPAAERADLAMGVQAARRTRRRYFEIQRGEADAVAAAPDRHRQDRAGR